MRLKEFLTVIILAAAIAGKGDEVFYQNDFEARGEISFMACYAPWIGDLKKAEAEGYIKVHRAVITDQNEGRSHSGVRSFALDITLDKSASQWGGRCYWRGPVLNIPLDKPVFLSGYLLPADVPPDIELGLGVLFNAVDKKSGQPVKGGSLIIKAQGADSEGWLVFQQDVTKLVEKNYRDAVMTGWQIVIHSPKAFHGQRIKLYADDIAVKDRADNIAIAGQAEVKSKDILEGGPYVVKYTSLFREAPDAANMVDNSSFELGFKSWNPAVRAIGIPDGSAELPSDKVVSITKGETEHGSRCLKISRPDGKINLASVTSQPIKIDDGKPYSLSFYARSSVPTVLKANGNPIKIDTGWQRYSIAIPQIKCYTRWNGKGFPGRYLLELSHVGSETVWIDAVQLEKGILSPYKLPDSVEFGLASTNRFGTFLPGETPSFRVDICNGSANEKPAVIKYRLNDFAGKTISEQSRSVNIPGNKSTSFTILLPEKSPVRHFKIDAELHVAGQPRKTASSAAAIIPDLKKLKDNDFFGSLLASTNPPNLRESLELNFNAGMKLMPIYNTIYVSRAPAGWRNANPQWQELDFALRQLEKYAFSPVVTIYDPIPAFAAKDADGTAIITPKEEQEVFDYCLEAARRFRGRVKYWEVFAEYMKDPLPARADNTRRVLAAAYKGLKQGNPDCFVIACGEDAARNRAMLQQLEAHFKLGTLAFMDAVSLHPYTMPNSPESESLHLQLNELRSMMRKYNQGRELPIWGTEAGFQGADTLYYDTIDAESLYYPKFITELQQADYQTRMNIIFFGEKTARNCSFFLDSGDYTSFSFVRRDNGITPKTVYPAFCNMAERLSGSTPVKRFEQEKNSLMGYFFRKEGKTFAALWQYDKNNQPLTVTFPQKSANLKVINMVGETVAIKPADRTELTLTGSPVYIYPENLSDDDFMKALENIRAEKLSLSLGMHDNSTVVATLKNGGSSPVKGSLQFILPPSWQIAEPANAIPFTIAQQQQQHIVLNIKKTPEASTPIPLTAKVNSDRGSLQAEFLPLFCARAAAPPKIDGDWSEFAAAPAIIMGREQWVSLYDKAKWNGNADLSAEVKMLWDNDNFYLAVKVKDDIFANPFSADGMLWANDALQLAWDMKNGSPYIEAAIALTAKGPAFAVNHGRMDVSQVKQAIRKTDDGLCYEIAIPWQALSAEFKPGNKVQPAFNLAVSDNDAKLGISADNLKGYTQSLQLTKGTVDNKSPELFGQLIFLP